jgi:hypothetical protein
MSRSDHARTIVRYPGSRYRAIERVSFGGLQLQPELSKSMPTRTPEGGQARAELRAIAATNEARQRAAREGGLVDAEKRPGGAVGLLDLPRAAGRHEAVGREVEERTVVVERERRRSPPEAILARPERTGRPP